LHYNDLAQQVNLNKVYDYYLNVLGRVSWDNKGSQTWVLINSDDPDAPYSLAKILDADIRRSIIFGNKKINNLIAYAHEFTHGVIETTSDFIYENESGAINESYCDILGIVIENDSSNILWETYKGSVSFNDNRILGDYINKDSLISCKNGLHWTHGQCDSGNVHHNSKILSHAAFLMYSEGGFGKGEIATLFYRSLDYLHPDTMFIDVRYAILCVARKMGYSDMELDKIANAFDEVGIADNAYTPLGTTSNICQAGGQIIDAVTGNPLPGATVRFRKYHSALFGNNFVLNENRQPLTLATDNQGLYFTSALPEGDFTIEVSLNGYVTDYLNIVSSADPNKGYRQNLALRPNSITYYAGHLQNFYLKMPNLSSVSFIWTECPGVIEYHIYFKSLTDNIYRYNRSTTGTSILMGSCPMGYYGIEGTLSNGSRVRFSNLINWTTPL